MSQGIARAVVIVLDGVGVGALPDAAAYGDAGADTLAHVAAARGGLALPHLASLGLGELPGVERLRGAVSPCAAWGRMGEASPGKDTSTGHWELMGVRVPAPFPVFPQGFPPEIIAALEGELGRRLIGNRPASGTQVLEEYGAEHLRTGALIVYTSADSVLQLAAHRDVLEVEELHECCRRARALLDRLGCRVLRVIARPFFGAPGAFERSHARKDFSLPPPGSTLPEVLRRGGAQVLGIGKVGDIFSGRGFTEIWPTRGNQDGVAKIGRAVREWRGPLVLANLLDFDTLFGHRNDAGGFAGALERFDRALGEELLPALASGDLLVITADHGCDPLTPGWDHTREYVPLLACAPGLRGPVPLGTRASHLDLAATLSEALRGERWPSGESFWPLLRAAL